MGMKNEDKYNGYDTQFLLSELKRYYNEKGKIPVQSEFDKDPDYPSRKTYNNYFKTFNNALRAAGFDIKDKPDLTNKEYLLSEINRFIKEFGRQPNSADMDKTKGYPSKNYFQKAFGSWNNALKELGLSVKVSSYTDEELRNAFFKFVEINERPPNLHEFNNNSEYPSFWCYQNRFGSWSETYIAYGFIPNDGAAGHLYRFENGELCTSNYEFDVSKWLRDNGISYLRNILFREFVDSYDGRKNCDYVIIHNGEFIWLEIAGLYTFRDKKSGMEKDYIKRFDHKVKNLLTKFNYKIFYPNDFKANTIDELFAFLKDIPEIPWLKGEPVYRGMPDEFDEVV